MTWTNATAYPIVDPPAWDPRDRYRRDWIDPRDKRERAWMKRHGLRRITFADAWIWKLLRQRPTASERYGRSQRTPGGVEIPHLDHTTLYSEKGVRGARVFVSQPYRADAEGLSDWKRILEPLGLRVFLDPSATWHYPGSVAGLVVVSADSKFVP